MTIYLYKKTHNKTGLQYLGKTEKDPFTYCGSGTRWLTHLEKHGTDLHTEIIKECATKEEMTHWGSYYSELWNIVESDEWANLRPETGDGGDTSKTENYLKWIPRMIEENKLRRWWNNGAEQVFVETPPNDSFTPGRLSFDNVGAKIGTDKQRGKVWVNNGTDEMMIHGTVPEGYSKGRLQSVKKGKPNLHTIGTKWWNNGTKSTMARECPGPEWIRGRL